MGFSAQRLCKCIDPGFLKPLTDVFDPHNWRVHINGVCLCMCVALGMKISTY